MYDRQHFESLWRKAMSMSYAQIQEHTMMRALGLDEELLKARLSAKLAVRRYILDTLAKRISWDISRAGVHAYRINNLGMYGELRRDQHTVFSSGTRYTA